MSDQKLSVITEELAPKIKKNLTKHDEYRKLLYTIGISKEPLSSTQLANTLGSKYIFEMLKELCPTEYTKDKILLKLEDLIEKRNNARYKCRLIKKFNKYFELDWQINENNLDTKVDDLDNNALITFSSGLTKNTDNSELLLIVICHGKNNKIAISLDPKGKSRQRSARLDIFQTVGESPEIKKEATIERHKNKTSIYTLKRNPITTARFLDVTLKPKVEKLPLIRENSLKTLYQRLENREEINTTLLLKLVILH